MNRIVFDTSIYIPLLRSGKRPGSIIDSAASLLYLSAVVAQELYAGAIDQYTIRALDELYEVFARNDRLIAPSAEDWKVCGSVLSQVGRKHGFESIKKGRLVNDVLIALSCKNAGATLLTSNHKDFQIIHEFVKFKFLGI